MEDKFILGIKTILNNSLEQLEEIDKLIRDMNILNEQFVLDFYDRLNEISVRL